MAGCSRKNSRKNSRKASRKNSRKNRKNSRRNNMRRNNMRRNNMGMNMYGGAALPEGTPSALNLGQGREFQEIHRNQHGGGSWTGAGLGAPVGDQGLLPQELVASARVGPTLQALQAASGMSDTAPSAPAQAGGGRRRKSSRKGRKASKKSKKSSRKGSRSASRKNRKGSRKNRKSRQRGGSYASAPAAYNAPTMLLSPAQAAKAGTADFSNPLLKY